MTTLASLLSSKIRAEVFRILFSGTREELHLREIQRRSGFSVGAVRQELGKLRDLGIISERRSGNRAYFQANTTHPLHEDIQSLVARTAGIQDVLRAALKGKGIQIAFIFGSVARGEEKAHSDVDLMVVGDITLRELTRRLSGVTEKIGREINPHIRTPQLIKQGVDKGDHFLAQVIKSEKTFLIGGPHDLGAVVGQQVD